MIVIATQCFSPDPGGIEGLMTGLADALSERGDAPRVFADRIRTSAKEIQRSYPIRRFDGPRPIRAFVKRVAIAHGAREAPVRGVFVDSWKSVAAVPRNVGPIAALAHGNEIPESFDSPRAPLVRTALLRAAVVIAASRYTAGLVGPFIDPSVTKVLVVNPPAVRLAPPSREAAARMATLIAGRSPVIATLARLEPRKGVDTMLSVMPEVLRRFPEALYVIGGDGADRDRLQAATSSAGLEKSVMFLGRVPDDDAKAALLSAADVFAMPTRREGASVEGFGIAYVEAAQFGVPALAGSEGGASDFVRDGKTGALCDGKDPASVADALFRLLEDAGRRQSLGERARDEALRNLVWPNGVDRYRSALALA